MNLIVVKCKLSYCLLCCTILIFIFTFTFLLHGLKWHEMTSIQINRNLCIYFNLLIWASVYELLDKHSTSPVLKIRMKLWCDVVFVIWDTVYRIDEDPACDMNISLQSNILNIQKTRILNFFFSQEFFSF